MNFLAHLYLSGDDEDVMIGNFIGDFVKGRLDGKLSKGVELHRAIDDFTDHHPVVKRSKGRLWPEYRHYSGVIVDIFYDHFLAANWTSYSSEPLEDYAARAYRLVAGRAHELPERVSHMLPYMVRGNWLVSYSTVDGIHRALSGMARRATFESRMEKSIEDLKKNYSDYQAEFNEFFPQLKVFSTQWLDEREKMPS